MLLPPGVGEVDFRVARAYGDVVYLRGGDLKFDARNQRRVTAAVARSAGVSTEDAAAAIRKLRSIGLWDSLGPLPDLLVDGSWHLKSRREDEEMRGKRTMEWTDDMDRRLIELRGMGRSYRQIRDDMGLQDEHQAKNRAIALAHKGRWPKDDPFRPRIHDEPETDAPIHLTYQCFTCDATFASSAALSAHQVEAHPPEPAPQLVPESADTPEAAAQPTPAPSLRPPLGVVRLEPARSRQERRGGSFQCNACGAELTSLEELREHVAAPSHPPNVIVVPLPTSPSYPDTLSATFRSPGGALPAALLRVLAALSDDAEYAVRIEISEVDPQVNQGGGRRA